MKLDQLRKIIREEVRAAIKEELQEVLTEAVRIASKPNSPKYSKAPEPGTTAWSAPKKQSRQELAEMIGMPPAPKPTNLNFSNTPDGIQEMLNMTKSQMTGTDYNNIINNTGASKPTLATTQAANLGMSTVESMQGSLDLSKLDFVKKAKDVLDLANKKSKGELT